MWTEVLKQILGDLTTVQVFAGFFFAFAGVLIKWWVASTQSVKLSPKTPDKFSLVYWISTSVHKLIGIVVTIVIVFLTMRFASELLGQTFSYFYCLGVGLALDSIVEYISKKKFIPIPPATQPVVQPPVDQPVVAPPPAEQPAEPPVEQPQG